MKGWRIAGSHWTEAVLLSFLVLLLPDSLFAQARPQAKPPAFRPCGKDTTIRVSPLSAAQGSLLRADVRGVGVAEDLRGEWAGKPAPVWADAKDTKLAHAFLGVDLERAPGEYSLVLTGTREGGEELSCTAIISVRAGKFAVEKLSVAKGFVDLNPEDQERSQKEGERLREIFATATPERLWQGKFRLPLDGAHAAKNFGKRRVLNGQPRSPHSGMDFPAAAGTPVHATQRGRVVLAEALFLPGNTVVIDHGLGIYSFYAHMESIAVTAGQMVEAGTVIGKVGATGRVTGAHLHWALTIDTARVNPLQIVGQQ
jgi:murein DD-endopeptidase MepM/ murein hydrolase activator NlpD